MKAALLTLLRFSGATLAHVPLLLTDNGFRRQVRAEVSDSLGLDGFWEHFERLTGSQREESIGPVLNKLRDFLMRPKLRRLLCQSRSTVDSPASRAFATRSAPRSPGDLRPRSRFQEIQDLTLRDGDLERAPAASVDAPVQVARSGLRKKRRPPHEEPTASLPPPGGTLP